MEGVLIEVDNSQKHREDASLFYLPCLTTESRRTS